MVPFFAFEPEIGRYYTDGESARDAQSWLFEAI
jgi:hypothetical protein